MENWIAATGLPYAAELSHCLRLVFAALLGGCVGLERTKKMRAAGLRTYMLVCLGSAMAMLVGLDVASEYADADATRIASQVVSGIGFIGAGTIMMTGTHRVRGLTTAAGLWATACLGLAIGAGYYLYALVMFAITVLTMTLGSRIQDRFLRNSRRLRVYVLFEDASYLRAFLVFLRENEIGINDFEQLNSIGGSVGASFVLKFGKSQTHAEVFEQIASHEGVAFVEEV